MIFRKKKSAGEPIPIERIQEMSSMGISDKEIIKKLKKEGYAYEEIERAMLQAVKEGVGEEPPRAAPAYGAYREAGATEPENAYRGSSLEDVFGRETQEGSSELPGGIPELAGAGFDTGVPNTDVVIEELVEGVVDEKWQRLAEKLELFEEKIESVKELAKHFEEKVGLEMKGLPTKELESSLSDQTARLDDLEARIGGLEKAFRQFLPSLTRNIENLSGIIHEMKGKTGFE